MLHFASQLCWIQMLPCKPVLYFHSAKLKLKQQHYPDALCALGCKCKHMLWMAETLGLSCIEWKQQPTELPSVYLITHNTLNRSAPKIRDLFANIRILEENQFELLTVGMTNNSAEYLLLTPTAHGLVKYFSESNTWPSSILRGNWDNRILMWPLCSSPKTKTKTDTIHQ